MFQERRRTGLPYEDGHDDRNLTQEPAMPQTATATKIRVGLYVRLEAKPGQENAVADFLKSAVPLVEREPATMTWYAIRMGPGTFGIFDTFADDQGREAHLAGQVAAALMQKAPELLASQPVIQKLEVLAAKLPE
jgi:quinol monooxygenase YgiN